MDRLSYISLLRVYSMLLIVFFHSLCLYTGTWWQFNGQTVRLWQIIANPVVEIGLALFVIQSGFLYGFLFYKEKKYKNPISFWINKIRRLLIPYLFWGIVCVVLPFGFHWKGLVLGIAHLWFLLVLFELFLIIFFIQIVRNRIDISYHHYYDIIVIVLAFSSVYIWKTTSEHHYILCIEGTLYYLPIFLIGFYLCIYKAYMFEKILFAVLGIIIGIILLVWYSCVGLIDSILIHISVIIVAICCIILFMNKFQNVRLNNLVLFLDKMSMGIYIFNQIVVFALLLVPTIYDYLNRHCHIGPFIIFVVSFFIPCVCSYLFNRTHFLSWMIGGINKKES